MQFRKKIPYSERRSNRCKPAPVIWHELFDWFDSHVGVQLEKAEQIVLDEILSDLFGYYLVALAHPLQAEKFAASRVSRQMLMNICAQDYRPPLNPFGLQGEAHRLPLQTDSVDVLVLPHILEYSRHPHEVLRETERVLIAEGHVVILGFNPFSIWMLWKLVLGWRKTAPWCGAFRSTKPIFGGGYAIVAKKRVVTLTPIRPRWSRRKRLVATGLVEPMKPHQKENYEQDS